MAEDIAVGDEGRVTGRWLRVTLDVEVRASEITRLDVLKRFANRQGGIPGWASEWAARQNRLLRALLADEETAGLFFYTVVKGELAAALDNEWLKILLREEQEMVLERAYLTLGAEDAEYFRKAHEAGKLFDEVGLMYGRIETDLECAELVDVRLLVN